MKAILHGRGYANELTGTVDDRGNLALDEPILISANSQVRVIILCSEEATEVDPDDTPIEEVNLSLRRALQEAKSDRRIPIAQMWESIDLPS